MRGEGLFVDYFPLSNHNYASIYLTITAPFHVIIPLTHCIT